MKFQVTWVIRRLQAIAPEETHKLWSFSLQFLSLKLSILYIYNRKFYGLWVDDNEKYERELELGERNIVS